MGLEQEMNRVLATTPKWVVVLVVITAAVALALLFDPVKDQCDIDIDNSKAAVAHLIEERVDDKKRTSPSVYKIAREKCTQGNSAGGCFEYFTVVREVMRAIYSASSVDCYPEYFETWPEAKVIVAKAIELMATIAWGDEPPATAADRYAWLSETEVGLYCHLKRIYIYGAGEEAWSSLRAQIMGKYPGKRDPGDLSPWSPDTDSGVGPKAKDELSANEIWEKSLLSAPCKSVTGQ